MKIVARTIIEIAGFPKHYIEEKVKEIAKQLEESKNFKLVSKDIAEVKEVGKMWSTFIEAEIEFKNIKNLMTFNFEFLPSSIEILEPEVLEVNTNDLTDSLNTLQAKLHEYTTALNKLIIENKFLKTKLPKSSSS